MFKSKREDDLEALVSVLAALLFWAVFFIIFG